MKVDKAVCTTNDRLDDLQRAIRYEAVFTTLVEKKVLAIKAEGEAREREKRDQTCFAGRFFRRKRLGSGGGGGGSSSVEDERTATSSAGHVPTHLGHVTPRPMIESYAPSAVSIESASDNRYDSIALRYDCSTHMESVSIASDATMSACTVQSQPVAVNVEVHGCDDDDERSGSIGDADRNANQPPACVVVDVHATGVDADDNEMKEVVTPLTEQCTSSDSTCADASQATICDRMVTIDVTDDGSANVPSTAHNGAVAAAAGGDTYVKVECAPLKSNLTVGGAASGRPKRTVNHVKMVDDSLASTSSHLVVSVISEDGGRRKPSSDTTISYPSSCKHTILSAPEALTTSMADSERHRLRVLEAKSVSAQCSPIFPRHTAVDSVATQVSYRHELAAGAASSCSANLGVIAGARTKARRLFSRQNTTDDNVSVQHNSGIGMAGGDDGGHDSIQMTEYGKKASLFAGKRASKKDKVPGEILGFISNFNQLTAHNNLPVVASQFRNAKLQRYLTADNADCMPRQKLPEERFQSRDIVVRDKGQQAGGDVTLVPNGSDDDEAKRNKKRPSESRDSSSQHSVQRISLVQSNFFCFFFQSNFKDAAIGVRSRF